MTPAACLPIEEGDRVLDLCAAPGGKATELAAKLRGTGVLVANDISNSRAKALLKNLELFGAGNILVTSETPERLLTYFEGWFDKILVDAPCSGEGMFRKEEAAVTDWSEATVAMCAARQQEILASAAEMLAPGGRLVYSTCTFSPEENEGVISAFLHAHPAFSVEPVEAPWFSPARPDWIDDPAPGLEHAFRLWPHCLRGEGHFAAVLRSHADGARQDVPTERPAQLPAAAADFLRSCTQPMPDGVPVCFGSVCYLAPAETPALSGLRVLRAGLELGELRRDRFSPAHALALWLHAYPQTADFPAGGPEIAAYLRGETLHGTQRGWTLLTAGGLSLGWVRGVDGILKNQYPKGLRRLR